MRIDFRCLALAAPVLSTTPNFNCRRFHYWRLGIRRCSSSGLETLRRQQSLRNSERTRSWRRRRRATENRFICSLVGSVSSSCRAIVWKRYRSSRARLCTRLAYTPSQRDNWLESDSDDAMKVHARSPEPPMKQCDRNQSPRSRSIYIIHICGNH